MNIVTAEGAGYTIVENASLAARNTFRVAARASMLIDVRRREALAELFDFAALKSNPLLVLGEGSNILFTRDWPGVVLSMATRGIAIIEADADRARVRVEAGENWNDFVHWSLARGFAGLENLAAIPGTVGAAPMQNIGAYGVEVREFIHRVEAWDRAKSQMTNLSNQDCAFAYRDSIFKRTPDRYVVTAVEFDLPRSRTLRLDYAGVREELAALGVDEPRPASVAEAITRIRMRKLPNPQVIGNAGSFFKNPLIATAAADSLRQEYPNAPVWPAAEGVQKVSAAWLVESCGFKGLREGDAGVSSQHALVLVNYGNATGAEIGALANAFARACVRASASSCRPSRSSSDPAAQVTRGRFFRADGHSSGHVPKLSLSTRACAKQALASRIVCRPGGRMAAVAASPSFVASRRRLFTALFASAGVYTEAALAMRRPGRTGVRDETPPMSPNSATFPPDAVRWLTRGTFAYSTFDGIQFNALGADDESRWQAWIAQQLAPASIDDSFCDAVIASAGFVTLNKTDNQLWTDHHSVTNDYYTRMLPIAETECVTLIRQIYSQRQLFEVMSDFWHDHFSVFGWDYDGGPMFVAMDRDAIRPNVFGNFRTMLQAVGESASMMYMLDLYASESGHPNENYARELMELHTLGAENYAGIIVNPDSPSNLSLLGTFTAWDGEVERLKYVDDDVYEAARALTGWTISGSMWPYTQIGSAPLGTFAYDDTNHDQGPKHILTRYFAAYQGQGDGTLLYDMLAQHPGTAHFVASKMCKRFVGDAPSSALVQSVATILNQQWQAPDQIAQAMQVILQSSEFKTNWGTKMKRPAMAAVGALRTLATSFIPVPDNSSTWTTTEEFISRLQSAGHRLFYWPAPNGYPDLIQAWSSTGAMGMTLKLLPRLLEMHQGTGYDNTQPFLADVQGQTLATFPNTADRTANNMMGYWCDRILGYRPEPTHTIAVDFMRQNAGADDPLDIVTDSTDQGQPQHTGVWDLNDLSNHYTIARLRTAIALILCSPEFLRR